MNITKQIAKDVTRALLEKRQEACNELEKTFEQKVRNVAVSRVPPSVMEMFLVREEYTERNNCVQLSGGGFNFDIVYLDEPVPAANGHRISLVLKDEEAKPLLKLHRDCLNAKKKLKNDFAKIEATLLSLRSYKNISAQFPEAISLLPKVEKTEIANIEQVRALIHE
jgi:hypothetical protein